MEGAERDKERITHFTTLHKVTYLVQYSFQKQTFRKRRAGRQAGVMLPGRRKRGVGTLV